MNKFKKINTKGYALTKLWYEKGKHFNYDHDSLQDASDFVNILWKSTQKVGFGIAGNGKSIYMVGLYYPG
jgi:hypothetical protein